MKRVHYDTSCKEPTNISQNYRNQVCYDPITATNVKKICILMLQAMSRTNLFWNFLPF